VQSSQCRACAGCREQGAGSRVQGAEHQAHGARLGAVGHSAACGDSQPGQSEPPSSGGAGERGARGVPTLRGSRLRDALATLGRVRAHGLGSPCLEWAAGGPPVCPPPLHTQGAAQRGIRAGTVAVCPSLRSPGGLWSPHELGLGLALGLAVGMAMGMGLVLGLALGLAPGLARLLPVVPAWLSSGLAPAAPCPLISAAQPAD